MFTCLILLKSIVMHVINVDVDAFFFSFSFFATNFQLVQDNFTGKNFAFSLMATTFICFSILGII